MPTRPELLTFLSEHTRKGLRVDVDILLGEANAEFCGHGIEVIRGDFWSVYYGDAHASYVNFGDTYADTIVFDFHTATFRVTTVGDYVETHQKYFAKGA